MYEDVYGSSNGDRSVCDCRKDLHSIVSCFMRRTGLPQEDIEDCTEDCLLRFLQQFGSMPALVHAMQEKRTFILLCTKNQVLNYCRTCRRRQV